MRGREAGIMKGARAVECLSRSVAAHKKDAYLSALSQWPVKAGGVVLKTDTFEDALPYGSVFPELCSRFSRVVACDISPEAVFACRAAFPGSNASWACADASRMALKDAACDAVFSPGTFSYLPEAQGCLQESYRVLKPGGALFAAVLNPCNAGYGIAKACRQQPACAGRAYGRARFTRMLSAAGFEVRGWRYLMAVPAFFNRISMCIPPGKAAPDAAMAWVLRRWSALARACRAEKFSSWLVMYYAVKPEKG